MHKLSRESLPRLIERVNWITLLVLIPLAAIPYGLTFPWWQAAFECVVFALGALWLLNGILTGSLSIRGWTLLLPLLGLCVYVAVQAATISADPIGTQRFLFSLVALVAFGYLLVQYASKTKRLYWLLNAAIGTVIGSALFGLVRLILQRSYPGLTVFGLLPTEGYGQYFNRNYFASMLVMILGLELGRVIAGGVLRKYLLFHLGLVCLLATSVVLTNSRGGIFAMMLQVIFLAVLFLILRSKRHSGPGLHSSFGRRVGRLTLAVTLIGLLVIGMIFGVTELGGDRLEQRMERLSSEVNDDVTDPTHARRAQVWQASWRLIKANPITGVGFGAYRTAIPLYHEASGAGVPDTAINGYLDFLSGGGLIGCAILAWFLVAFFLNDRLKRRSKRSIHIATRVGGLAGLFGFGVHSLVDNGLNIPFNSIILTILVVICIAKVEGSERESPSM